MKTSNNNHYLPVAVTTVLLFFGSIAYGQSVEPEPQIVFRKMLALYASVSSYQDSGVVRIVPGDPSLIAKSNSPFLQDVSLRDEQVVSFKIYYARPEMFRFEWTSPFLRTQREAIIWSDGRRAYQWVPDRYTSHDPRFTLSNGAHMGFYLDQAMASSGGSVFVVPSLLMKDVAPLSFGKMISAMKGLSLVGEEQFDGETCYIIKGNMYGTPWALWVGKESNLLRKTRTLYSGGSFHEKLEKGTNKTLLAEEVHCDIRINKRIPQRIFKHKPKLQLNDVDLTR